VLIGVESPGLFHHLGDEHGLSTVSLRKGNLLSGLG
jgi:hypothetical protein